jgi:hypothetical protein
VPSGASCSADAGGARRRRDDRGRIVAAQATEGNAISCDASGRLGNTGWHAFCFYRVQRRRDMYSILYIIGAIVVIIVVLRLLGLY